jgi:ankyrin repeat protein
VDKRFVFNRLAFCEDTRMSKKRSVENIRIQSPCTQPWDEMAGNDRVRFCTHCSKEVNDLSRIGRREGMRLVRRSGGNLCVRYAMDPMTNGPIFAGQAPVKIRRAPAIAAGVVGATLGLSSMAYAQGDVKIVRHPADPEDLSAASSAAETEPEPTARLRGMVVDPNGAVVPGSVILLRNRDTGAARRGTSGADGSFAIDSLPGGIYSLVVPENAGFDEAKIDQIEILEGGEAHQIVELPISEKEFVLMGAVAFVSEVIYTNPLSEAAANGDINKVLDLLAANADPNAAEPDGNTPIFVAVEIGNTEIVRALLTFGADVNVRNDDGETPLMQLNETAEAALAALLIEAGAKVNLTSKEGNTALIAAAADAPAEVLKVLIDTGAEVNARDDSGWTALMKAAYDDDFDKVQMLLFAGADVNAKNSDDETAWDQATVDEIEDLLVSHGAIVEDSIEDYIEPDEPGDNY